MMVTRPSSDATSLLSRLEQSGVRFRLDGNTVAYDAPKGVLLPQDLTALRKARDVVIDVLRRRSAAQALWDAALRDVSEHWNHSRATRDEITPPPDDVEAPLEEKVADALRAGDLERTRAAASRWRLAWLKHLGVRAAGDVHPDGGYVEIESETLGERIVVALREGTLEDACRAHGVRVVYSPSEIEHLHSEGAGEQMLRVVHLAKKELGGKVIDPGLVDVTSGAEESVRAMLRDARTRFNPRKPDTAERLSAPRSERIRNRSPPSAGIRAPASAQETEKPLTPRQGTRS